MGDIPGNDWGTHERLTVRNAAPVVAVRIGLRGVPVPVTVTVRVPRNSRDPEAHALARARALVGVDEPEHIDVTDFNKLEKSSENIRDDIYVELHFNGYFED